MKTEKPILTGVLCPDVGSQDESKKSYAMPDDSVYSINPKHMKIGDYAVELRLPTESEDWSLERERLQVNVTSKEGAEYYADFVTLSYIKGIMNEKFREHCFGNFFPGRGRIIIKDLAESTVTQTLEYLLNSEELEFFLRND